MLGQLGLSETVSKMFQFNDTDSDDDDDNLISHKYMI